MPAGGGVTRYVYLHNHVLAEVGRRAPTTIWLARLLPAAQGEIDAALSKLRALRCDITSSQMLGCFAVDVPADCSIEEVDRCLATLAPDRVALAYPSFRHAEGETEES